MNTQFKPVMKQYGSRKFIPLYFLVILLCMITPGTNWFIPIAKKVKTLRGRIILYGDRNMIKSEAIKPISYLKTHASKLIRDISNNQKTMIITQNGEAKVILQDIKLYEQTQESLAMLKILATSTKNLKDEKIKPIDQVFKDIRKRIKESSK